MALSEHDIELIQKLIGNTISAKDRTLLNDRMKDPEFKDEIYFQAKAVDALAVIDRAALKEYLESPEVAPVEKKKASTKRSFWIGFIIGLSIVAALYLFNNFNNSNKGAHMQLAEKYDDPYPAGLTGRGVDQNGASLSLVDAYRQDEYGEVIQLYKDLQEPSDEMSMLTANSYIQLLNPLLESQDDSIAQNAEWYTAIAHLGAGSSKQAVQGLENIVANKNHLFNSMADKILNELNN